MRGRCLGRRGSGLIIVLGVLAMLAIMATSFVTLMRLDVKATTNYVDDTRCEMLAMGALNYFKSVLRDDLDRTWGKYENRDGAVGAVGWAWSANNGAIQTIIPGLNEGAYGTPVSNDFWFNSPVNEWTNWGALFTGEYGDAGVRQFSFSGGTGYSHGVVARYWDAAHNRDFDLWVARTLCAWGPDAWRSVVHEAYPGAGSVIDFDSDGDPRPPCNGDSGAFYNQETSDTTWYYDTGSFLLYSGDTYFIPGTTLTRERAMAKGLFWRWAVKLGVPHGMYIDMNASGNLLGQDGGYLSNIGQLGLQAMRCEDEAASTVPGRHLGRLRWKGFSGEQMASAGGFPRFYDEVNYQPSQISLENLFSRNMYPGVGYVVWDNGPDFNLNIPREKAQQLIAYRLGPDGFAGDSGHRDQYRPGWRRDGGTYYKFPSPENPLGDDRYFGMNEVMEHDRATYNSQTSEVAGVLTKGEWRSLRPYVTMWSADTILRGKIWPTEGPLPWRSHAQVGDWRHIDILKRVNINIIGASGPEGLSHEDAALKNTWRSKRARERDRLYYMLVAGMTAGGYPTTDAERKHQACQFVASLADTVDRDQNETYYPAPDGSGAWALGVEKSPVINEVIFHANGGSNTASYALYRMRIELYNPAENIPWIPDADEAYDVRDYVIKIGDHAYRLGDLDRYSTSNMDLSLGKIDKIGADGMYGVPDTAWIPGNPEPPSWSRCLHVGWNDATPGVGVDWPDGLTRNELEGPGRSGVTVSLWKRLSDSSADGSPAANVAVLANRVEDITVRGSTHRYVCVDTTGQVQLVRPWNSAAGENGPAHIVNDTNYDPSRTNEPRLDRNETRYTGIYRRWDPMNAKIWESPGSGSYKGKDDRSQLLWCPGYPMNAHNTLGRPNAGYPGKAYWTLPPGSGVSTGRYFRHYERNVKIVDGDLPSIGWLGELFMKNAAQDGPLTWVHQEAQSPIQARPSAGDYEGYRGSTARGWKNQLDTRAKFDLFRPFAGVSSWPAEGEWSPYTPNCRTQNIQILDIFTVWDPSNDGIDNDGDGAVDDEDTGFQAGDKGGPEVRVFGRLDLNTASRRAVATVFPDNYWLWNVMDSNSGFCKSLKYGRMAQRANDGYGNWGPIETIGDIMRADSYSYRPGTWISGSSSAWISGPTYLAEGGFVDFDSNPWGMSADPATWKGDDDGDGIFDERDERDMIFTWVANHITTRSQVFEIDLQVDVSDQPGYPDRSGDRRKLPFPAYKVRRSFAKKQVVGIFDRSSCLRIAPDGACEFSGPVELRSVRFTDDKRTY